MLSFACLRISHARCSRASQGPSHCASIRVAASNEIPFRTHSLTIVLAVVIMMLKPISPCEMPWGSHGNRAWGSNGGGAHNMTRRQSPPHLPDRTHPSTPSAHRSPVPSTPSTPSTPLQTHTFAMYATMLEAVPPGQLASTHMPMARGVSSPMYLWGPTRACAHTHTHRVDSLSRWEGRQGERHNKRVERKGRGGKGRGGKGRKGPHTWRA